MKNTSLSPDLTKANRPNQNESILVYTWSRQLLPDRFISHHQSICVTVTLDLGDLSHSCLSCHLITTVFHLSSRHTYVSFSSSCLSWVINAITLLGQKQPSTVCHSGNSHNKYVITRGSCRGTQPIPRTQPCATCRYMNFVLTVPSSSHHFTILVPYYLIVIISSPPS